jgi:methylated-DNA-[protein]-cysteine S-methyltransferase
MKRAQRNQARPAIGEVIKVGNGWLGIAASRQGVSHIVLPKRSRRAAERALTNRISLDGSRLPFPASRFTGAVLARARREVGQFLAGRRRTLTFPVDLRAGSPFQRRVWRAALRIPYGRVRSYQWIAQRVGGKQYARAVGLALGANCVPLAVPCHRVVAHDGSLGGFTGGLSLKRKLLALERGSANGKSQIEK